MPAPHCSSFSADVHGLFDALEGVGLRLRTDVPFDIALLAKYFFRDASTQVRLWPAWTFPSARCARSHPGAPIPLHLAHAGAHLTCQSQCLARLDAPPWPHIQAP